MDVVIAFCVTPERKTLELVVDSPDATPLTVAYTLELLVALMLAEVEAKAQL